MIVGLDNKRGRSHVKDVGLEFMATNKVLNFYLMEGHKSSGTSGRGSQVSERRHV